MSIADRAVYPTQRSPLRARIEELLKTAEPFDVPGEVLALVVPDTNRIESAPIAARIYKSLEGREYDTVVVVSPSHTGAFKRMNITRLDSYSTPLGDISVNDRMRNELCDEDDDIFMDDTGHFQNEGIDVQLPFLQMVLSQFDLVPIVMGDESPDFCRELGHAIGEVIYNRRALVVATADVLKSTPEGLERLSELFEARDLSPLMALLNSEEVHMEGKGALLVALIAATHRRAAGSRVLQVDMPEDGAPGSVAAVLWR